MKSFLPRTLYLLSLLCYISEGSISKSLKYYEVLHADSLQHRIVKRDIHESAHPFNKITEISFKTLGKQFRLVLSPKHNVFDLMFKAYAVDGNGNETPIHFNRENFYGGRVFGENSSEVNLHVDSGLVTGTIHLQEETYHIEPSWRHLPDLKDNRTMITYKDSDVKFSWDDSYFEDNVELKTCEYIKVENELEEKQDGDDTNNEAEKNVWKTSFQRQKRQFDRYDYTPTKTRCPLLLIADYRFYKEMGRNSVKTSVHYLISLIDRINKIFNDTEWDNPEISGGFKGMGFVIKEIIVHTEPTQVKSIENHYNMARESWNVRDLLEVFSRQRMNKEFCLAHLFTHQVFNSTDSIVTGLSYLASPRRLSVGGICTIEYFKNGHNLFLNTGLSSTLNRQRQRVITRQADLNTAHELGHSWGSEHDPDTLECSPNASLGGSYLMYSYGVSGLAENNKKFSSCSVRSITKVLLTKSGRCFTEPKVSFCGNLRIENDEECDVGLSETEEIDPCCDSNCVLRRNMGAVCSDRNSPCCQNCRYMSRGIECRKRNNETCELESTCSGMYAECPDSLSMPDETKCQDEGRCRDGKCVPVCATRGMQSCMCDTVENACKRCCRTGVNSTCTPIKPNDILPDSTPCFQGFCIKGTCRVIINGTEDEFEDIVENLNDTKKKIDIIEDIKNDKVLLFLKDNIVLIVVVTTALLWILVGCIVGCRDYKRQRKNERFKLERQYKTNNTVQIIPLINVSNKDS